jgi:hypothetical protein
MLLTTRVVTAGVDPAHYAASRATRSAAFRRFVATLVAFAKRRRWATPAVALLLTLAPALFKNLWPEVVGVMFERSLEAADEPLLAANSAPRALPFGQRGRLLVADKAVELRSGPSSTQQYVGHVPARHFVRVVRARYGWILVAFVDPAGDGAEIRGWVRADAMRPLELEAARLLWCQLADSSGRSTCD